MIALADYREQATISFFFKIFIILIPLTVIGIIVAKKSFINLEVFLLLLKVTATESATNVRNVLTN